VLPVKPGKPFVRRMCMDITGEIAGIIMQNIESKSQVFAETDLRKDLNVDSFGTLMIINGLEDKFGINIDETDFRKINTVADIAGLIESKYLDNKRI
jgi:acyl carrier protein